MIHPDLPRFSDLCQSEVIAEAISRRLHQVRRQNADPARQTLARLCRLEIVEWQYLKRGCEPCSWHIGSASSPFFADIQAARAAVTEAV
jgi:hypothetical protein